MRRIVRLLIALSIPAVLFLSVYQVFRYQRLETEISQLREEQKELFEQNKRLIAHIAILESPRRIAKLATDKLDLQRVPIEKRLRIIVSKKENGNVDG